jgi:PKHD-type hydroxylase
MESYLAPQKEVIFQNWYIVRDMFSNSDIERILQSVEDLPLVAGTTLGDSEDYRISDVKWIPKFQSDEYGWIYDRLWHWVEIANSELWDFELIGFKNDTQYTEYAKEGKYDWHMDICGEGINHRKISLTCCLNEGFEGGNLMFKLGREDIEVELNKGDACIFPSFYLHRVAPITKGKRKSLVQWISGNPYR